MIEPGVRSWSYVSYFCSPFHVWFVEMGYPRLDVLQYPDGEWAIIQMMTAPLIPAETKWRRVLEGMQNIEISFGFIKQYVEEIDVTRRAFWDREERRTAEVEREHAALDRHREDMVERASQAILRNPDLCERIAEKGVQEMDISNIRKHIPNYRL